MTNARPIGISYEIIWAAERRPPSSAVLTMPTLGYVVGFMAASAAVGTLAARGLTRSPLGTVAAMLVGNVVIYGLGLIWLRHALSASWSDAIAWGLTPFLVGDAVKIALAVGVLPAAWSFVRDWCLPFKPFPSGSMRSRSPLVRCSAQSPRFADRHRSSAS